MSNIDAWLDRKYSNLERATAAAETEANARAGLLGAQAAAVPIETSGRYQAELGQAAASRGAGAFSQAQAEATPGLAGAEQAQRYGGAELSRAQAAPLQAQVRPASDEARQNFYGRYGGQGGSGTPQGLPNFNLDLMPSARQPNPAPAAPTTPPATAPTTTPAAAPATSPGQGVSVFSSPEEIAAYKKRQGFASGTEKVPGKGSGKKDTQKAMLAPGEAVLNKAAAEHLGRNTIALLNAIGEQKMGMDNNPQNGGSTATDQGTTLGYADGTEEVPGYAKGASKIPGKGKGAAPPAKGAPPKGKGAGGPDPSPKLLAALMQMGGGPQAGGMPSPDAAQPMPMPMPMSGGRAMQPGAQP